MYQILIPQLNANDESCIFQSWYFESGQNVSTEDVLATIETSKATSDIICESEGILHTNAKEGDELRIGEVVGLVFENQEEYNNFLSSNCGKKPKIQSAKITKLAQIMIDKHGITEQQIQSLKVNVIKKEHIIELLKASGNNKNGTIHISQGQKQIAKVVSLSHSEIPKASMNIKIYLDNALNFIDQYNANEGTLIGINELLIQAIIPLPEEFPFFFGSLENNDTFNKAKNANIGITMDIGKGLFIPVVKYEKAKNLQEISDLLMDYRIKALRGTFDNQDFDNANISITINTEKDVISVAPIILPGQTCMISVNSRQEELFIDNENNISKRSFIYLGITYDHRVINGFDATSFLKNIKENLETIEVPANSAKEKPITN